MVCDDVLPSVCSRIGLQRRLGLVDVEPRLLPHKAECIPLYLVHRLEMNIAAPTCPNSTPTSPEIVSSILSACVRTPVPERRLEMFI